ncbi:MAG: ATP-dependent DNA helicase RecQ [Rikenellaceae bacterium]
MQDKFLEILKRYWKYDSFRENQLEAITSVCSAKDTLVLLPTGGGKSLLYQIPALYLEGICIVITPLISLMKDQVDALRKKGILARAIHSGMTPRQIDMTLDNCVYGNTKLLYISPERIASEMFRVRFSKMKVSLIAVDEAHCIAQWGHDFRPQYLNIATLRSLKPEAVMLALTASATPEVKQEIIDNLKLDEPHVFQQSPKRNNIHYIVRKVEDKNEHLLRVINNVDGCGIVYARTRQECEQLCAMLEENGISAEFYHGGLPYQTRTIKQERWIRNQKRVMVATNAFGMGIDKADVRFVVHYDLCDSIEAYYQEAGRAGRDGKLSYAVLLVGPDDNIRAGKRLNLEFPTIESVKDMYQDINNFLQIGIGEGAMYPNIFSVNDFAIRFKKFPLNVNSAIKILQYNNYLTLTDEVERRSRVNIKVSRESLYRTRVQVQQVEAILTVLLRKYSGIFTSYVSIDENEIATLTGYTPERVVELLKILQNMQVLHYKKRDMVPMLILFQPRVPQQDLYISPESYLLRKNAAIARLESMSNYGFSMDKCRSVIIQEYFGESNPSPCLTCDVCRSTKPKLETQILKLLEVQPLDVKEIVRSIPKDADVVIEQIEKLLDKGEIVGHKDGKLSKKG